MVLLGRIRVISKIIDKSVLLWIEVDIPNQLAKIGFLLYLNSPKSIFKKTAGSEICLINRLSIALKQAPKGITYYPARFFSFMSPF